MSEVKLPRGWRIVKFKDVTTIIGGGTPSTSVELYYGGDIPWLSPVDLSGYKEKYISKGRKNITKLGLQQSSARLLPKNSVLFSSRAPIGYVAIAENEMTTNQGFKNLLPSPIYDPSFAYYYLKFKRDYIKSQASGTTFKEISGKKLGEIEFILPPLSEQQRIVTRLDAVFGHLDVLKEKLDRIPILLKNFRQQVLTQAVTGELTKEWREENLATVDSAIEEGKEIISEKKILYRNQTTNFLEKLEKSLSLELNGNFFSDDWCAIKPEFISSPEKYSIGIGPFGSNLKVSDYKTEGYPLIFVRNVIANQFTGLDPKFVDKEKFQELLAHSIKPGDLLITKMGTPPGDCKLYPENSREGIITSDILKVRIWKKYFVSKFYEYVISSKIVKTQIEAITKGVAHQKISLKRFKEIELPFPTKKEQEEIVNKVDALFGLSDKIQSQYQSLKAKIDQMPQAILAKAFRGELVEQEVKEYVREAGEVMMAAESKLLK